MGDSISGVCRTYSTINTSHTLHLTHAGSSAHGAKTHYYHDHLGRRPKPATQNRCTTHVDLDHLAQTKPCPGDTLHSNPSASFGTKLNPVLTTARTKLTTINVQSTVFCFLLNSLPKSFR